MHPGLLGDGAQYQCEETAVGGWGRHKSILLKTTRKNQNQEEHFILFPPRENNVGEISPQL